MAIAKATAANTVKPLDTGTIIRRFTVGTAGVTAGDIVELSSTGVVPCDGSDGGAPIGIVIQTAVATEKADVVTHGSVVACTGATVGGAVYPTDGTAGAMSQSASTKKYRVGVAQAANIVFVAPLYIA